MVKKTLKISLRQNIALIQKGNTVKAFFYDPCYNEIILIMLLYY